MSSDQNPICTINPYEFLEINQNPDGTITRLTQTPSTPAAPDPTSPVLTQDFPLNPTYKTFLRLFLPNPAAITTASPPPKLPIILYFHGGGFVFHHADSTIFHNFCSRTAALTAALVVSVEYRLAPEHRLPAAYEDAVEALRWIRDSANKEGWLLKYADFSNCFLMGSSGGGNIAYHAALHATWMVKDLEPLKISGLILHQPFFGGSGRTGSEIRLVNDPYVPLSASDLFWELGLPVGAGRDHEYCNPRAGCGSGVLGRVRELGWRVLLTGCSGDPLVDRAVDLVELLEENGVMVKGHFTEDDYHSVDIFDSGKCNLFLVVVKDFLSSSLAV